MTSILPEPETIRSQLIENGMTEAQIDSELQKVYETIPFFKGKLSQALIQVGKRNKISLKIKLKSSGISESQIMKPTETIKLGEARNSEHKLLNMNGYIISKSELKTASNGNSFIVFTIADETGELGMTIFGEYSKTFNNTISFALDKPIHIHHVLKKPPVNGRIYFNYTQSTKISPYNPQKHGELCEVDDLPMNQVQTIDNLVDKETMTIQGVASTLQTRSRIGCEKGHSLGVDANHVGKSLHCAKCKPPTMKDVVELESAVFALTDDTGEIMVDIPFFRWGNEKFKKYITDMFEAEVLFLKVRGYVNESYGTIGFSKHEVLTELENAAIMKKLELTLPEKIWNSIVKKEQYEIFRQENPALYDTLLEALKSSNTVQVDADFNMVTVFDNYSYKDLKREILDPHLKDLGMSLTITDTASVPKTSKNFCIDEIHLKLEPTDEAIIKSGILQFKTIAPFLPLPYDKFSLLMHKKFGGTKFQMKDIVSTLIEGNSAEIIEIDEKLQIKAL